MCRPVLQIVFFYLELKFDGYFFGLQQKHVNYVIHQKSR